MEAGRALFCERAAARCVDQQAVGIRNAVQFNAVDKAYEAALATVMFFRLDSETQTTVDDPARMTDAHEQATPVVVDRSNRPAPSPLPSLPPEGGRPATGRAIFPLVRTLHRPRSSPRMEGLQQTPRDPDVAEHHELWRGFIEFLYESCVGDTKMAMTLGKKTPGSCQAVPAGIHKVRFLNNIVGRIELVEVAADA